MHQRNVLSPEYLFIMIFITIQLPRVLLVWFAGLLECYETGHESKKLKLSLFKSPFDGHCQCFKSANGYSDYEPLAAFCKAVLQLAD